MKKTTLRILCSILVLFMIVPMLFACGDETETTEKHEQTESPKDTESETDQGNIKTPQESLELVKDGISKDIGKFFANVT